MNIEAIIRSLAHYYTVIETVNFADIYYELATFFSKADSFMIRTEIFLQQGLILRLIVVLINEALRVIRLALLPFPLSFHDETSPVDRVLNVISPPSLVYQVDLASQDKTLTDFFLILFFR